MTPQEQLAETVRIEGRRVLATLIRVLGDMQLAEDAVQEAAFGWPAPSSVPDVAEEVLEMTSPDSAVRDDMLRLVFTCCHPALAREAQVALALRTIAGLEVAAIARAFLVPEATMAKRLVRARQKIKHAQIPYRVPSDAELPERLPAVLAVVHLIFTEAHAPSAGDDVLAVDLAAEAVRLARLLNELMPGEAEVSSLLALLFFTSARRAARVNEDGSPVLLADQDRSRWDHAAIAEGQAFLAAACEGRTGWLGPISCKRIWRLATVRRHAGKRPTGIASWHCLTSSPA